VAAIPDAAGTQYARRGVMIRVRLRVVVLGGLVTAGWLLGSGTGLAHEDTSNPHPAHESLAPGTTGLVGLVTAPPPDGGFGGPLGAPPTVESTMQGLTHTAPVHRLAVLLPARVPVVTPVLTRVSRSVSASVLRAVAHAPATRSRAAVDTPAPVSLAGPLARTAPGPIPAAATAYPMVGHPLVGDVSPATAVSVAAHPAAGHFAGPSALDGAPAPAVPASPPATTAVAWLVGSNGSGATTKSSHFVTFSDRWVLAGLGPRRRVHTSSGRIPRSAAEQPCTSPD
jgi:hypothetical protein